MSKSTKYLTPEQFVTLWQSCATFEEFLAAAEITATTARQREYEYRKRGVNLKRLYYSRRRAPIDVDRLNRICAGTGNGRAERS